MELSNYHNSLLSIIDKAAFGTKDFGKINTVQMIKDYDKSQGDEKLNDLFLEMIDALGEMFRVPYESEEYYSAFFLFNDCRDGIVDYLKEN